MRRPLVALALAFGAACADAGPAAHPWVGRYALAAISDSAPPPAMRGHIELAPDFRFADVLTAPALGYATPDTLLGAWTVASGDSLVLVYDATNSGFQVAWRADAFELPLLGKRWRYAR